MTNAHVYIYLHTHFWLVELSQTFSVEKGQLLSSSDRFCRFYYLKKSQKQWQALLPSFILPAKLFIHWLIFSCQSDIQRRNIPSCLPSLFAILLTRLCLHLLSEEEEEEMDGWMDRLDGIFFDIWKGQVKRVYLKIKN